MPDWARATCFYPQFFGAGGVLATISSQAIWTDAFDFAAGDSATFDFFIPGAVIAFEANNIAGLTGNVSVAVLLNGVSLFNSFTELTNTSGTPTQATDLALTQSGTALAASFGTGFAPGFGLGGAGYTFGAFTGSLDLVPAALIGSNTLSYVM